MDFKRQVPVTHSRTTEHTHTHTHTHTRARAQTPTHLLVSALTLRVISTVPTHVIDLFIAA